MAQPRRRAWGKWALRLVACAGIGAVATVGVAWGSTRALSAGMLTEEGFLPKHLPWPTRPLGWPERWPDQGQVLWRMVSALTTRECLAAPHPSITLMDYTYERTLAGWPARAVLTGRLSTPIKPQLVTLVEIGPIPIWRGVAIDTAFYSGLAFVLWCAPRVIRWQRRRARGQCPACGYDLSGLPQGSSPLPCPECGAKRAAPRHH